MLCVLVRIILPPSPGGSFPCTNRPIQKRRQKRRPGDGGMTQQALPDRKRLIPPDENPIWMRFVPVQELELEISHTWEIQGQIYLVMHQKSHRGCLLEPKTRTVSGNFRRLRKDYFNSIKVLSIRIPVPIIGTNVVRYWLGIVCALQTLDSLRKKLKWQYQLQCYSMHWTPTWYNSAC